MSTIPFFSASAVHSGLNLHEPISRVLERFWYVLGAEVTAFEQEYADYLNVRHCLGVANGTDALEIALRAAGVAQGDRVITVANAGFYGSTAVLQIGATPVYVDVDQATLTMNVESLRAALDRHAPKAIIVTHLYGQLADIEAIVAMASSAGVAVIEDCAQAHGANRAGKQAGSFGTLGCFSFYPTKNLGAVGDGGAVVTNDPALAERVKQLRQYGWTAKYRVEIAGGRNSRLDEVQAAVLRAKLPHLDAWNEQRRLIASRYNAAFADLPVQCPSSTGSDYVAHLYVIRTGHRDALRQFLSQLGIATDVHYPVPDHLQSVNGGGISQTELPVTERACAQVLSLPCFPGLADDDVKRVIDGVRRFFSEEVRA